MDMRRLVGRNFARLRLAKGFTQERFAEVSGVTQQYVSGLERGKRNCLLWRICGWLPREAMDVRRELEMGAPA